jgi:hypothetical protein
MILKTSSLSYLMLFLLSHEHLNGDAAFQLPDNIQIMDQNFLIAGSLDSCWALYHALRRRMRRSLGSLKAGMT